MGTQSPRPKAMSFVFYPKHEYGCPCVKYCPHVGGASIGQVVREANHNREHHQYLLDQVDALQEQNRQLHEQLEQAKAQTERLRTELKEERRKKFAKSADNQKKQDENSEPTKRGKGKKKRGAPKGHPGWFREMGGKPDATVPVDAPARCPLCKASVQLHPKRKPSRHPQDDIIDGRIHRICFVHPQARCTNPGCRRWVQRQGPGELLGSKIGPHARSMALFLRTTIGVSVDNVVSILHHFNQLHLSSATVLGFEIQAAQKAKPLAQDVAKKLNACEVVHADESYWNVDKQRWYVWFHGNDDLAHFVLHPSRQGQVSRDVLGESFDGVLVTDCYSGYARHSAQARQKCLAHVRRSALDWRPLAKADAEALKFFDDVVEWAERGMAYDGGRPRLARKKEQRWLRQELERLENIKLKHDKAKTLQQRLIDHHDDWLTFITYPNVPATNNLAERALRPLVIIRKITFGHRNPKRARGFGDLMTAVRTAQRQGRKVLDFLKTLICEGADRAVKAMYAPVEARSP